MPPPPYAIRSQLSGGSLRVLSRLRLAIVRGHSGLTPRSSVGYIYFLDDAWDVTGVAAEHSLIAITQRTSSTYTREPGGGAMNE